MSVESTDIPLCKPLWFVGRHLIDGLPFSIDVGFPDPRDDDASMGIEALNDYVNSGDIRAENSVFCCQAVEWAT